jgi:hypothetical protein
MPYHSSLSRRLNQRSLFVAALIAISQMMTVSYCSGFSVGKILISKSRFNERRISRSFLSSGDKNNNRVEYSRDILLREEVESPFRKVRFFIYATSAAGCITSLLVSLTRILAALSGVNTDLMNQSLENVAVDSAVLALLALAWKRDTEAQQSKLQRAAKGAELAKLTIRAYSGDESSSKNLIMPLSSLRQGRGIEKRVAICAASSEKLSSVLQASIPLGQNLVENDWVIVPVVVPQGTAPLGLDKELLEQKWLALPCGGNWKAVLDDEVTQASSQGIDLDTDGFTIVMKKNGKVGQRTRGINLKRLCGEVMDRKELGLDVTNV